MDDLSAGQDGQVGRRRGRSAGTGAGRPVQAEPVRGRGTMLGPGKVEPLPAERASTAPGRHTSRLVLSATGWAGPAEEPRRRGVGMPGKPLTFFAGRAPSRPRGSGGQRGPGGGSRSGVTLLLPGFVAFVVARLPGPGGSGGAGAKPAAAWDFRFQGTVAPARALSPRPPREEGGTLATETLKRYVRLVRSLISVALPETLKKHLQTATGSPVRAQGRRAVELNLNRIKNLIHRWGWCPNPPAPNNAPARGGVEKIISSWPRRSSWTARGSPGRARCRCPAAGPRGACWPATRPGRPSPP